MSNPRTTSQDDYFDMLTDTPVTIDGIVHQVCFENGMTGIGSRRFWVDGKAFNYGAVRQSPDLKTGNHFLYLINWREQPWDKVYIFIHEDHLKGLLENQPEWRNPQKIIL